MRIFACSDLHGDAKLVESLVSKLRNENIDVVVIAGDLSFAESGLEGIVGPFKEVAPTIILIPGNHETPATIDFLCEKYKPNVFNLHGRALRIGDVGFFGLGLASIGLFNVFDEEAFELLSNAFEPIKDAEKKVLVTHEPPYGTKLDFIGWHTGSRAIREIIEKTQPDVCICGHIHETFGKQDKIGKTLCLNVGRKGVIIEL